MVRFLPPPPPSSSSLLVRTFCYKLSNSFPPIFIPGRQWTRLNLTVTVLQVNRGLHINMATLKFCRLGEIHKISRTTERIPIITVNYFWTTIFKGANSWEVSITSNIAQISTAVCVQQFGFYLSFNTVKSYKGFYLHHVFSTDCSERIGEYNTAYQWAVACGTGFAQLISSVTLIMC